MGTVVGGGVVGGCGVPVQQYAPVTTCSQPAPVTTCTQPPCTTTVQAHPTMQRQVLNKTISVPQENVTNRTVYDTVACAQPVCAQPVVRTASYGCGVPAVSYCG